MKNKFLTTRILSLAAVVVAAAAVYAVCAVRMPPYFDEGIWGFIGKTWVEAGLPPLVGSFENKNIGIYILYAASHAFFGLTLIPTRVIGVLATLLTGIFVYRIGKKEQSADAGLYAFTAFLFSRLWLVFDGTYASVSETYSALFVAAALSAVICENRSRLRTWIIAGLFLGAAFSFRQISAVAILPLIVVALTKGTNTKNKASEILTVTTTFALTIILTLTAFLFAGVPAETVITDGPLGILANPGNVAPHFERAAAIFTDSRCIIFLAAFGLFALKNNKRLTCAYGLIAWFMAEIFATSATLKFWGHNFVNLLPVASIIFGICADTIISSRNKITSSHRSRIFFFLLTVALFFPYSTVYTALQNSPDSGMHTVVAQWIDKNTKENEKVFMLSSAGSPIAYLMHRRIVSRHENICLIINERILQEVQHALRETPPEIIVYQNVFAPEPTEQELKFWRPLISSALKGYSPVFNYGWYTVMRRNDTLSSK